MSSGKGGKDGKDGKEGVISKVAGVVLASGVAWFIFKSIKARKEEQALIQEYYGDREDFVIPESEEDYAHLHDAESHVNSIVEEVATEIKDRGKLETTEVIKDFESKIEDIKAEAESKKVEDEKKPWFLSLFNPPKPKKDAFASPKPQIQKESSSKFSIGEGKGDVHEIKKGDTLWELSGRYGVSVDSLRAANGINGDLIYAGDTLVIPHKY